MPSQALALLNNELVVELSRRWAERLLAELPDSRSRIETMFLTAYGRPVESSEIDSVESFLHRQAGLYDSDSKDVRVWADLGHALLNAKEFIFIR